MTKQKTSQISKLLRQFVSLTVLAFLSHQAASGQEAIYSQDFDTDSTADWVVNTTGDGYSYGDFFFDYSTVGIPSAPNSAGGTTRGLKLGANLGAGGVFPAGVSVSPLGFGISENFEMRFDLWLNFNKSGQGSTEVGGAGYGTAGTSAQVAGSADSLFIGATTDGGSGADYRVYGPGVVASYQDADHVIRGDTNSPLVYAAGSRNNSASYYATNFAAQPVPEAQTNLFPRQTGTVAPAGSAGFKWHDVTLRKIGTVITYQIDGLLIGTVDSNDAGTPAGNNILFNFFDINTGGSVDVDATNVLFALFDNVRIVSFTNVVNVSAVSPMASENGPSPGVVSFTRSAADGPLTVNYTVEGTATSGSDFVPLSGTVTFGASDLSADVTITPIDDNVSELPETVVVTIVPGDGYVGAGSATVTIADNDIPTLNISVVQPTMYEPYPTDFIKFRVDRYGNLDAAEFAVNLTYGGSAVAGTDFVVPTTVTIPTGAFFSEFTVSPIDNSTEGPAKTVTVNLAAGSGYAVGTNSPSATGTIIDDETTETSVLYSSPLTDAGDSSKWAVRYGTGDPTNNAGNYGVEFGFDLSGTAVPAPPGGATKALRLTANKLQPAGTGAAGAVNVYYTNQAFSGDFAVRFNLNLVEDSNLGSATEGVVFGINHSGSQSNWWYGSGPLAAGATWSSDGIWYYITSQPGGSATGDFQEFTGSGGTNGNAGWQRLASKSATAFVNAFKANPDPAKPGPFTSYGTSDPTPGVPANVDPALIPGASWADVEIKQVANVVTLSVNKTPIFSYTNTTVWTNGYLMLGYSDPFSSSADGSVGAAYFANLEVVGLTKPEVTQTVLGSTAVTLTYTTTDTSSPFVVEAATTVDGTYAAVNAVITYMGNGTYQAVAPRSGETQFFRVRRQ
jgi:hypothetical protein